MNRMMEIMPLMFFFFSLQVASGLALYWVISNLYTFAQQYFTMGWGTLPFVGASRNVAPPPPNGGPPAGTSAGTSRSRRKGSGSSAQRRKK